MTKKEIKEYNKETNELIKNIEVFLDVKFHVMDSQVYYFKHLDISNFEQYSIGLSRNAMIHIWKRT